ncbi:MAG: energy transducer TonB [Verrucomicrobia bacterium]|nr:MAG: energy transducer TonB [Verrucomicrobiota bacterium]
MYVPSRETPRKSLVATAAALLLALSLFLVLPLANHVSFQRVRSEGGLSSVPTSPPRTVDVRSSETPGIRLEAAGDFPVPVPQVAGVERKIELEPLPPPVLEPHVPAKQREAAFFVFDVADLDAPPIPIHRVAPAYPGELAARRLEGEVLVEFRVNEEGEVLDVRVLEETHPLFGRSVAAAVRRWRFLPGTVDGRRVHFRVRLPVTFRLDDWSTPERDALALASDDGAGR